MAEDEEAVLLAHAGDKWYAKVHGEQVPLVEDHLAGALCLYVDPAAAAQELSKLDTTLEWVEVTKAGWVQVGLNRLALVRQKDVNTMFGGLPFDEQQEAKPKKTRKRAPPKKKEEGATPKQKKAKKQQPVAEDVKATEEIQAEQIVEPPLPPETRQTIDDEAEAVLPDYPQTQATPPTP